MRGEVRQFGAVAAEVVGFSVADAHGAVALVLPCERAFAEGFALQCGDEALARQRCEGTEGRANIIAATKARWAKVNALKAKSAK